MIRRCSWVCGHGQGLRRDRYVAGVRERLGEIGAVEEEHGMPGIVQGRRRPRMERGKREDKARRDVCVQPCLR
jgi:hypothetical protein